MIVTVCSGGLDSTTLVYWLRDQGEREQLLVSFDYGQRHAKELSFAERTAQRLGFDHKVVDLRGLTPLLHGSALTDASVDVPEGHYAEDSMKATVVPNRNAIMLSIACGIAVAERASAVAIGVHAGDHFIYPDCRPEFIDAMDHAMRTGTEGFGNVELFAPFLRTTKTGIARMAGRFDVPIGDTWSCYQGGDVHCGACGTCFERREALRDAGVHDPTVYAATPEFEAPRS